MPQTTLKYFTQILETVDDLNNPNPRNVNIGLKSVSSVSTLSTVANNDLGLVDIENMSSIQNLRVIERNVFTQMILWVNSQKSNVVSEDRGVKGKPGFIKMNLKPPKASAKFLV